MTSAGFLIYSRERWDLLFQQLLADKHHRLHDSKFGREEVWVWSPTKLKKQEDLLDLTNALLKVNCFGGTTVAMQCTFQSSPWWLIEFLRPTSLDQHNLYYCNCSHSCCEISNDVMVLFWNFLRDMYGHERYERYNNNTINNSFLS